MTAMALSRTFRGDGQRLPGFLMTCRDGGAAKGYVLYFGIQSDAGLYHLNYVRMLIVLTLMAASEVPGAWSSLIERVNRSVLRLARANPEIVLR